MKFQGQNLDMSKGKTHGKKVPLDKDLIDSPWAQISEDQTTVYVCRKSHKLKDLLAKQYNSMCLGLAIEKCLLHVSKGGTSE